MPWPNDRMKVTESAPGFRVILVNALAAPYQHAIEMCGGHDLVAEDLTPVLEALVAGEHGGSVLVAPAHELEEVHRTGARDRQVADLVDDQERGMGERLHPVEELAGGVRLLEARDQVGQGAVVDAA
jgi:hypothetical protein